VRLLKTYENPRCVYTGSNVYKRCVVREQTHRLFRDQAHDQREGHGSCSRKEKSDPYYPTYGIGILFAPVLAYKHRRPALQAENDKLYYEDGGICHGYPRHLFLAEYADHKSVDNTEACHN
jgi:hypothetical protein